MLKRLQKRQESLFFLQSQTVTSLKIFTKGYTMSFSKISFLSLLFMPFCALSADVPEQPASVKVVTGSDIQPYENTIVKLRMEELSKFPYLIWNGEAFEKEYAATYAKSKSGAAAFAYKNDKIVGALTGVALKEYDEGLAQYGCPLIGDQLKGIVDPKNIYHLGEIIAVEQNWEGPISKLFTALEEHAKSLGYDTMSFITIVREQNHPQMPPGYQDKESSLLRKLGYENTGRTITYYWPTVQPDGSAPNQENVCPIWIKKLSQP